MRASIASTARVSRRANASRRRVRASTRARGRWTPLGRRRGRADRILTSFVRAARPDMSRAFALRAVARVAASRTAATRARASRASFVRASSASSSPTSSSSTEDAPSWEFRVLYDGACPLCVREIEMLRARDTRSALSLVDVADDAYSPSENAGIEYETAMATIHGLTPDERVITGVEVFERAYAAVGMGWVYAFTRVPALLNAANAVYDVWARYRLEVTGRGSLAEHLKARKARADGETCEVGKACE